MSLLDKPKKTPYQVVGVEFGKTARTYFYRAPLDMKVCLGDRVVTPNNASFSIPTVVGLYPAGGENDEKVTDWLVQVVDTTRYNALRREYAL